MAKKPPKITKPKDEAARQQRAVKIQQIMGGIIPGRVTHGDVVLVRAAKKRAAARRAKNKFK